MGISFRKPTVDYTAEDYSTIMSTNLESAYHLCQLAHPLLKASGAGSIVFVSSVAGVVSLGTGSIYAATKGMLLPRYTFFFFNNHGCSDQLTYTSTDSIIPSS